MGVSLRGVSLFVSLFLPSLTCFLLHTHPLGGALSLPSPPPLAYAHELLYYNLTTLCLYGIFSCVYLGLMEIY